jgi:glycosyltransferase involved in cell wall biosynthesis
MRILHVIPGLTHERGGPTVVVEALTRHQAAAGHAVTVLTTDQGARHGERPALLDPKVGLERYTVRGPDRLCYAPGFASAVRARVRQSDVVHVHSLFTFPIHAALREAARAGKPVILRPCGLLHPYSLRRSRWLKRAYLAVWGQRVRKACWAWHYTSEQEAVESWPGNGRPCFVLPNGIEPEDFTLDRSAARERVGQTWPRVGEAPYVLFLSRLHPKKRLDVLIEAFLAGAPQTFRLVVAGPDATGLWPRLAARFLSREDAARRVCYVGSALGENKAALLAGASLFALPSEHENFGIAALESLAAGTPVLLSPHVDLAEPARAAAVGFVEPPRVAAWAERLGRLLADGSQLAALTGPARAWVRHHFSWARITTELRRRYEWVLRGCPEPANGKGKS